MSLSPAGEKFLRRRRLLRWGWAAVLGAAVLIRFADWYLGRAVDDWGTFDHRSFVFASVVDDGAILIRSADGSTQQIVRLLGVDVSHTTDLSGYLGSRLAGRTITLLLDSPQTRDGQRRLLAYVFASDTDNLNVDVVRDGLAYADRREHCLLEEEFRTAQADAKKKRRGVWGGAIRAG
jgi:Staphylococcal nuclease homologue